MTPPERTTPILEITCRLIHASLFFSFYYLIPRKKTKLQICVGLPFKAQCLGEILSSWGRRCKGVSVWGRVEVKVWEKQKDSLYLDHPLIFLFHVFPCCSAGKVLAPQQKQKLRRSPAVKKVSQSQQKGNYVRVPALLDDFIQPG